MIIDLSNPAENNGSSSLREWFIFSPPVATPEFGNQG
jgi:hypothetical protein